MAWINAIDPLKIKKRGKATAGSTLSGAPNPNSRPCAKRQGCEPPARVPQTPRALCGRWGLRGPRICPDHRRSRSVTRQPAQRSQA